MKNQWSEIRYLTPTILRNEKSMQADNAATATDRLHQPISPQVIPQDRMVFEQLKKEK
jgi:hypothetical protein